MTSAPFLEDQNLYLSKVQVTTNTDRKIEINENKKSNSCWSQALINPTPEGVQWMTYSDLTLQITDTK